MLMPASGASVELAGISTSMVCPLENGVPAVNVPIGTADPGTSVPAAGSAAAGDPAEQGQQAGADQQDDSGKLRGPERISPVHPDWRC